MNTKSHQSHTTIIINNQRFILHSIKSGHNRWGISRSVPCHMANIISSIGITSGSRKS